MNPAGFLFGPNAIYNVGGMMTFTSADYLRLADGVRFNAIPDAAADALLSTTPVAAYGFLGSNPGAITVQGSQFTVTEGTGISLVGGNITIQSGTLDDGTVQAARLSAPGGQINIASGASPGEILASNLQLQANVNGESFTSLGNISIVQDTRLDTAGATSGTIMIRGGQLLVADGATIASAASSSPPAPAGSVTMNGTGVQMTGSDVTINGTNVSVTASKVTATNLNGSGGTITITAGSSAQPGNVTVAEEALLNASGDRGGSVTIRGKQLVIADAMISADTGNTSGASTAIDINVTGYLSIADTRGVPAISARATGTGDAGEVRISSANLNATSTADSLSPFALIDTHTSGRLNGGDVSITTLGNLSAAGTFKGMYLIDSGTTGLAGGTGGSVAITAANVNLQHASINTGDFSSQTFQDAVGSGGNLSITADGPVDEQHFRHEFVWGAGWRFQPYSPGHPDERNSLIEVTSIEGGSTLTINADKLVADSTSFEAVTALGREGHQHHC
jgi:hypothetical protein